VLKERRTCVLAFTIRSPKLIQNPPFPTSYPPQETIPQKTLIHSITDISRKPIAARGVLLDYRAWATPNSIAYSAFSTHRITLPNLLACAESQGTTFQPGDILLIRSGWMEDYLRLSAEQQDALGLRSQRDFVGVENTYSMAKWHWDMQFAAVAGDTNAYKAWPPTIRSSGVSAASDGNDHGNRGQGDGEDDGLGFALHEVFLAGWGMPIGEVWNLEELARKCRERGIWSFFLTSQPLDVPGGVDSPCNAMAVL
jgi:hypothetical protein